jgi:potassium-transporting ATPase ATP-binding subunit
MTKSEIRKSLFDLNIILPAMLDSIKKLHPRHQIKNPVMFVVFIGSLFTTGLYFQALLYHGEAPSHFILAISLWLWFTLIFANFSESLAEGRGKAQAAFLRKARKETFAKKLSNLEHRLEYEKVFASDLRKGDMVLVEMGDIIPMDGDVIEGVASVDESAITGESAPVIRESGGDRSAVTGGTKVLSDWMIVLISSNPGETFLDHMIAMVEGTKR